MNMSQIYEQYKSDAQFRAECSKSSRCIGISNGNHAYEFVVAGIVMRVRHNRNGTYTLL